MDSSYVSKANKKKLKEQMPVVVPKTVTDIQRIKLERLMQDMEKPVIIPDRKKDKKAHEAPEFVRNVMGSSAGAGSGEFHVYRHLRRKEYARQKHIDEKAKKEELDEEFHKRIEENKKKAEEKTAKKRLKRPVFVFPIVVQGFQLRAVLMPHQALSYMPLEIWTRLGSPHDDPEVRSGHKAFNQRIQLGGAPPYDFEAEFKILQQGNFIQLGLEALTTAKVVVDFAARQMTVGNATLPIKKEALDYSHDCVPCETENSFPPIKDNNKQCQSTLEMPANWDTTQTKEINDSESNKPCNPILNLKKTPLKSILKKPKTEPLPDSKSENLIKPRATVSKQLYCSVPKKRPITTGELGAPELKKIKILEPPKTHTSLPNLTTTRQGLLPTPSIPCNTTDDLFSYKNTDKILLPYKELSPGLLPTPHTKNEPSVALLPTPSSQYLDEMSANSLTPFKDSLPGLLPTPRSLLESHVALLPRPFPKLFKEPSAALLPTPMSNPYEKPPVALFCAPYSKDVANSLLGSPGIGTQEPFHGPTHLGLLPTPKCNNFLENAREPLLSRYKYKALLEQPRSTFLLAKVSQTRKTWNQNVKCKVCARKGHAAPHCPFGKKLGTPYSANKLYKSKN